VVDHRIMALSKLSQRDLVRLSLMLVAEPKPKP
jgi:hypothetical protein